MLLDHAVQKIVLFTLSGTMHLYGYNGSDGFNVAMHGPIFLRFDEQVESFRHSNKGGKQFLTTQAEVQRGWSHFGQLKLSLPRTG